MIVYHVSPIPPSRMGNWLRVAPEARFPCRFAALAHPLNPNADQGAPLGTHEAFGDGFVARGAVPCVSYVSWNIDTALAWRNAISRLRKARCWVYRVWVPDNTLVQVHLNGYWTVDGPGDLADANWHWVRAGSLHTVPPRRREGASGEILVHANVRILGVEEVIEAGV